MRTLKCIIVDDEPLALDLLESYVKKTPFLELVERFVSPYQAMQYLTENQVDLVFLDIQMPGITGIELSKVIQNGPKVVFTTAYSQYALEGFKVDAIDYLVKPFNYQEFLKAANKALTWFNLVNKQSEETSDDNAIFVKSEYKLVKIEYDKIIYIEGLKDYVKIYMTDHSKPVLTLMTLKSLEERLPSTQFMRVHRSYIVNLTKINTIERSRIVFGSVYIPIADGYKEKFQGFLDKRFME
ncbi:DNA-binding response regulator [Tenuifilaceae bacterium CYCD]|nr:DNA-binding response regulator [Tenuifilaceae bacterium CYCD]